MFSIIHATSPCFILSPLLYYDIITEYIFVCLQNYCKYTNIYSIILVKRQFK
nr:MAG TPA: hypothetical protein [Caudoviricetes sp.]